MRLSKRTDQRGWVLKSIENIVPSELRPAKLTDDLELRSLGIDSLGLMVLLEELCRACNVDVASVDPSTIIVHTVGDLISAAESLVRG